jgi:hypothetical protein
MQEVLLYLALAFAAPAWTAATGLSGDGIEPPDL